MTLTFSEAEHKYTSDDNIPWRSVTGIPRHYVYRHIRQDKDEPFYIGIGSRKNREGIQADYRANSQYARNEIWKRITNKTNYEVEILMESDNYEFIKDKEREFIKLYGRIDNGTGILSNLTDGGDGILGRPHSEETKYRISESQKGKKMNPVSAKKASDTRKKITKERGYWLTPEQITKGAEKRKGKVVSEETRKKISDAQKGKEIKESTKVLWSLQRKGTKQSEEAKKKKSNALVGKKRPIEVIEKMSQGQSKKPIEVTDTNTGYKEIYKNQKDCAEFLGCNRITVMRTLLGKKSTNIINNYKINYL